VLFNRGKYNTSFYRWVGKWLHKEWEDARLQAGHPYSLAEQVDIKGGLYLSRTMVNLLGRLPNFGTVQFQPAEGR
jgi:hypothetical protein